MHHQLPLKEIRVQEVDPVARQDAVGLLQLLPVLRDGLALLEGGYDIWNRPFQLPVPLVHRVQQVEAEAQGEVDLGGDVICELALQALHVPLRDRRGPVPAR